MDDNQANGSDPAETPTNGTASAAPSADGTAPAEQPEPQPGQPAEQSERTDGPSNPKGGPITHDDPRRVGTN